MPDAGTTIRTAIEQQVPCPHCGVRGIRIQTLEYDLMRMTASIEGVCDSCTQIEMDLVGGRGELHFRPYEVPREISLELSIEILDLNNPRGNLEVEGNEQDSNQGEENMIYVVTEGSGKDFCIVSVFDNRSVARDMAARVPEGKVTSVEIEDDLPRDGRPWDVFILTDDDHQPLQAALDKRVAMDLAKCSGYRVCRYTVSSGTLQWAEIRGYKFFVVLREGRESEAQSIDICYDRRRAYAGEEMNYRVTHRRRYSSSLPHRLEVVGHNESKVRQLARQMARLSYEQVLEKFEYNVDYVYEYNNETDKWERNECYDVVEALD